MEDIASFNKIFDQVIEHYHLRDDIDGELNNPMDEGSMSHLLYHKCWVDTVQWHLEDQIRDPDIDPSRALAMKRRIDLSNQKRTDLVEKIDDFYLDHFKHVAFQNNAKINTESPAWAIDRLSILALKIYHMKEQVERTGVGRQHRDIARQKLNILEDQREDLTLSITDLIQEIRAGRRLMKVYRQMKMYNDPLLNPVLYRALK
jgi:hypothetical protein